MRGQFAAGVGAGSGLSDGGVSWGVIALGVLGFLALVAVCGFGVLARLRDREADRRSLEALRAERLALSRGDTGSTGHLGNDLPRDEHPGRAADVGNGAAPAG